MEPRARRHDTEHLLHGDAREHRLLGKLVSRRLHEGIALLDQEPIALALLDLHQRPLPFELVTLELEEELPLLQTLPPILEGHPFPAVPDDDGTRPVVPLGDHALEVTVLDRMILYSHRQALVVLIIGRAPRH